jgi:hypothetical protein
MSNGDDGSSARFARQLTRQFPTQSLVHRIKGPIREDALQDW